MQTRTEYAAYVENNDFIVLDGEVKGYVYMVDDHEDGSSLVFDVVNDEGDRTSLTFAPFDYVTIVESFLDEDDEVTI